MNSFSNVVLFAVVFSTNAKLSQHQKSSFFILVDLVGCDFVKTQHALVDRYSQGNRQRCYLQIKFFHIEKCYVWPMYKKPKKPKFS